MSYKISMVAGEPSGDLLASRVMQGLINQDPKIQFNGIGGPHMQEAGYGSIINMSSMSSINKSPAISAYAASKAAINHMTANLAHDYGPIIRINAVGPGAVRTGALATVLTPEIEKRMLAHTPIKRLGEPEDIAGAVLYFAAPVSQWVSGQVLFVNGGGEQTLD